MATQIQLRNDTAANWTSSNPTLAKGEMGVETDTAKYKIGDGTTNWTSLAYSSLPSGAYISGGPLGTPSSGTLTNATGLPISTGVSGLGTGVATFLATPTSANLAAAVTNETGTGNLVFHQAPTLLFPTLNKGILQAATEVTNVSLTGFGSTNKDIDVSTASVWFFNANSTSNAVINLRGTSLSSFDSLIAVGQTLTVAVIIQNGATGYYPTGLTIDGASVTPKWAGGTAPAAGNASANDVYTYAVVKTASTPTYVVHATATKFA